MRARARSRQPPPRCPVPPRLVTRGSGHLAQHAPSALSRPFRRLDMGDLSHRFDWYQATVQASQPALLAALLADLPEGVTQALGKGFNSFSHRVDLADDGEILATVMHGGVNPNPNVKSTGDAAPALADFLRRQFPGHRVSRLDVCIDMRGDSLFEDVVRLMSQTGRAYRLKGEKIIPDDLDDGSTYYLGSRASPLRVRCYEKGKQLYKLTGDPVWRMFFDWVRLELQVRPEKAFKVTASEMEPEAFWGCAAWTRDLAHGALAMNPDPVAMKPTRIADHERAMRALTAQYGATIRRQVMKLGSWEAFTADLQQRLGLDLEDAA